MLEATGFWRRNGSEFNVLLIKVARQMLSHDIHAAIDVEEVKTVAVAVGIGRERADAAWQRFIRAAQAGPHKRVHSAPFSRQFLCTRAMALWVTAGIGWPNGREVLFDPCGVYSDRLMSLRRNARPYGRSPKTFG